MVTNVIFRYFSSVLLDAVSAVFVCFAVAKDHHKTWTRTEEIEALIVKNIPLVSVSDPETGTEWLQPSKVFVEKQAPATVEIEDPSPTSKSRVDVVKENSSATTAAITESLEAGKECVANAKSMAEAMKKRAANARDAANQVKTKFNSKTLFIK